MMRNEAAARARELVGVRFRPQGRRREHGLDCLGVVALAGQIPVDLLPANYRMRSEVGEGAMAMEFDGRVTPVHPADACAGDVLLVEAGLGHHHFLVLVEAGFVHADASIGRVVETPGAVPWPVRAAWRFKEL